MSDQIKLCMPYYSISDTNTQSYITALNNYQSFSLSNYNITQPLLSCQYKTLKQYLIYSNTSS